jgi:hypothetical protein
MEVLTDLHGHTHFSDGRATPEDYVLFRHALGMAVVAVADHDVMAASRAASLVARQKGMLLVPAMETTSFLHFGTPDAEQVHILAYFPPSFLDDGRLEKTFLYNRGLRLQARWRTFVLAWLDALPADDRNALDPHGRFPSLADPVRFPALQTVIDLIVSRRRALFDAFRVHHVRFWTEDKELFGWSPEELIDVIRADGALDVVAHPVRVQDKARMDQVLEKVSGVEVYTSRHKAEVAAHFRAFAESRGKFWTASSDDHQNARYTQPPCGTPAATVERILGHAVPEAMLRPLHGAP